MIGPPEGKYSVSFLGSLAKFTSSSYSDVEYIIILEKETDPYWARKIGLLINCYLVGLQETFIVKSMYGFDTHMINRNSNFPPSKGVMPDIGGKTPLGRLDEDNKFQLYGTIGYFTNILHSEDKNKNLAAILLSIRHAFGQEELAEEYQASLCKLFDKNKILQLELAIDVLLRDWQFIKEQNKVDRDMWGYKDFKRCYECFRESLHIIFRLEYNSYKVLSNDEMINKLFDETKLFSDYKNKNILLKLSNRLNILRSDEGHYVILNRVDDKKSMWNTIF